MSDLSPHRYTGHSVEFDKPIGYSEESSWTIRHPARCHRLSMRDSDCPVQRMIVDEYATYGRPKIAPGRYVVSVLYDPADDDSPIDFELLPWGEPAVPSLGEWPMSKVARIFPARPENSEGTFTSPIPSENADPADSGRLGDTFLGPDGLQHIWGVSCSEADTAVTEDERDASLGKRPDERGPRHERAGWVAGPVRTGWVSAPPWTPEQRERFKATLASRPQRTQFDLDSRRDARRHPILWWRAKRRVRREVVDAKVAFLAEAADKVSRIFWGDYEWSPGSGWSYHGRNRWNHWHVDVDGHVHTSSSEESTSADTESPTRPCES